MIETVMIFALGFLAATFVALLVIPAINARAERLARRRAEALFPMSIAELTADKDHLRAEFAVLQRRLERRAEEALAVKHKAQEELGRQAIQIDALETLVAERDRSIAGQGSDLSDTRKRLADTTAELAATKTSLTGARDTLAALEDAHRRTLDELAATRGELERANRALSGTRAELSLAQDRQTGLQTEHAALGTRWTEALNELDARRITISALETRLATQTARGDEFERALSERRTELSEERQRLADLARNLLAEQERGLVLEGRIREVEAERDERGSEIATLSRRIDDLGGAVEEERRGRSADQEKLGLAQRELEEARLRIAALEAEAERIGEGHAAEIRGLSERLDHLRAEKASVDGALATAREERTRLDRDLQALRRSGAASEAIQAENEDLRRRIVEVADRIMEAAPQKKGAKSRRVAG